MFPILPEASPLVLSYLRLKITIIHIFHQAWNLHYSITCSADDIWGLGLWPQIRGVGEIFCGTMSCHLMYHYQDKFNIVLRSPLLLYQTGAALHTCKEKLLLVSGEIFVAMTRKSFDADCLTWRNWIKEVWLDVCGIKCIVILCTFNFEKHLRCLNTLSNT